MQIDKDGWPIDDRFNRTELVLIGIASFFGQGAVRYMLQVLYMAKQHKPNH